MTESTHSTGQKQAANQGVGSTPQTRKQRKIAIITLSSIFLFLGFIWLIYWLIIGRFAVYTDDAYVNGNLVELMPQIPGTVVAINTDDTLLVSQGQTIIKLDSTDMQIAYERAHAALANTVRQVRQYFEKAERAQQTLILRNADLLKAQQDYKRRVGLVGERAISREEMQHYKTALETARAQYYAALFTLRSALALVENTDIYSHPLVAHAKANFKRAYINLQRTTIVAPVTGFVAKRQVQVGQQVDMKTPMLAIVPLAEVWVDANYKETQLSGIRIGQAVTIYADAYPDVTYHGKVMGLNAGTGAAFSLLPPQNATGNWIKIVQRLPVRMSLEPNEIKKNPLQLGLSMRVTTNIHDRRGNRLSVIAKHSPVYVTDVYAHQLGEANTLIAEILQKNSPNLFLPRMTLPEVPHGSNSTA